MKPLFALTSILLFACSNPVAAEDPKDSELLLERAFYLETIEGSPAEALELYRQIQQHKGIRKQVRARALLGEAICLDAIGKDQLARKRFQDVIKRYPLQGKILEIARGYTRSRIWDTPARYMPEEILFYAEMVQPGEEIIRLPRPCGEHRLKTPSTHPGPLPLTRKRLQPCRKPPIPARAGSPPS